MLQSTTNIVHHDTLQLLLTDHVKKSSFCHFPVKAVPLDCRYSPCSDSVARTAMNFVKGRVPFPHEFCLHTFTTGHRYPNH